MRRCGISIRIAGGPACRPASGALVEKLKPGSVTLTLVNVSPVHARDVVVQTGGYAEHRCTSVTHGDRVTPVDESHFRVRLEPGTGGRLVLSLDRYSNSPTLAFPLGSMRFLRGERRSGGSYGRFYCRRFRDW